LKPVGRLVRGCGVAVVVGALVALSALSCGRNKPIAGRDDASVGAGMDANPTDQADGARGACLDDPTQLQRPPSGSLPCDLIPPGLTL